MMSERWVMGALALLVALVASCTDAPIAPVVEDDPLVVGQSREIELRYLRFDVSNYAITLDREDLQALPADTRRRLWLLDLDLSSGPSSPRLLENNLAAIRALDPDTLDPAARNMRGLLTMTPDTADLSGTSLEALLDLAPLLGLAPATVLSDLLKIDVEAPFLSTRVITETILALVIGTHPNARQRLGPRTSANPLGRYPVTPGALPVSLDDVLSDFATLSARYGPYAHGGEAHPGFIVGESRARVLREGFSMTVRANTNALPYKGVDLTGASTASVSAIPSQIRDLFDFDDPGWLRVEGLVEAPVIEQLTFRLVEHDGFVRGGRDKIPAPMGASDVWALPPWTLERVVAEASLRAFGGLDSQLEVTVPGDDAPIFTADVASGWATIDVTGGLGDPPPPSYLWDMLLEVAQVRLHDGGLREGEADAAFTLRDVPVGLTREALEAAIRQNLEADPALLLGVAARVTDATRGDADLYYVRAPDPDDPLAQPVDWLVFIAEEDVRQGDDGQPVRPYSYARAGFFVDAALEQRVSDVAPTLDGDATRQKVRVSPGDRLYVEDDTGAVFQLDALQKPSTARLRLRVTRVR